MKVEDLDFLAWRFKFSYELSNNYGWQSGWNWKRAFMKNSEGVTIGRFTFRDGKLYSWKIYKPSHYAEFDEGDVICLRLSRYLLDGMVVPLQVCHDLISQAKLYVAQDLKARQQWRMEHPKFGWVRHKDGQCTWEEKSRRKLTGRNPTHVATELIHLWPKRVDIQKSLTRKIVCV